MYGPDAQYWNAGPGGGDPGPNNVLVNSNSTVSTLNFTVSSGGNTYTGVLKGNFSFNGPISTLDQVSGVLTDSTLYKNGFIKEHDVITQGTDLIKWIFTPTNVAQYIDQASTLNSGVTFVGSQGGSQVYGDTLIGGTGNDSFTSFAGKLTDPVHNGAYFDGKGGLDTAIMQGKVADYKIVTTTFTDDTDMSYKAQVTGWQVADSVANRNGITRLVNVERLHFTDYNIALDIGKNQVGGEAYMLYKAAFNRAPDFGGLGFWIKALDSGADLINGVAQSFVNSKEFNDLYGANISNTAFASLLYTNVLHRPLDQGGYDFWVTALNNGTSRANVLENFASSKENADQVASLIASGILYTPA